jgi:hypothetical protein
MIFCYMCLCQYYHLLCLSKVIIVIVISQAPFLCHYSLRFKVRKPNEPFSKTETMFFQKIWGTFHTFSQFSQLQEINPSVSPHFLAITCFLAICEKVCGRPPHFLTNCEKACDCEKAWADKRFQRTVSRRNHE